MCGKLSDSHKRTLNGTRASATASDARWLLLVKPDAVAARISDRRATRHALGVLWRDQLRTARCQGVRVCRVELIDEEPDSAGAAGPVPDVVASGDEHEQKEIVMPGLPEDK